MIIVVDFSSISNQINHKFKLIKSKMILQKSTTIIIAFIFTVLIQNCFPYRKVPQIHVPQVPAKAAWTAVTVVINVAFVLYALAKIGPCSQCQFCKGGAAGCKKVCQKGKNTPICKTCISNCS